MFLDLRNNVWKKLGWVLVLYLIRWCSRLYLDAFSSFHPFSFPPSSYSCCLCLDLGIVVWKMFRWVLVLYLVVLVQ